MKNKDEITAKVRRKLEVTHYYILFGLLSQPLSEFNPKDRETAREIEFIVALRKYLNLGEKKETTRSFIKYLRESLPII